MHRATIGIVAGLMGLAVAASAAPPGPQDTVATTTTAGLVVEAPEKVRPLGVGAAIPDAILRDASGTTVSLRALCARRPTVIIFFRGGWCPFCVRHLADLGAERDRFEAAGLQLVAIAPDKPELIEKDALEKKINFTMLSDASGETIKAFGLAFREMRYNFLPERSGYDHHILPVPAAYLVDPHGVIRFAHWDPDYRRRIEPSKLLEEAGKVGLTGGGAPSRPRD